ncbi:hypothetical protein K4K53_007847 [Colletotrichum sp. SAR 10_77]|nr:hypothetical protein K4K51_007996 [Colletotrichum sp. SAR 10_75]KAI8220154.1 hypothetical protein K4K53_007847 [Colletotrichum sp. SAR 10_77]
MELAPSQNSPGRSSPSFNYPIEANAMPPRTRTDRFGRLSPILSHSSAASVSSDDDLPAFLLVERDTELSSIALPQPHLDPDRRTRSSAPDDHVAA